MNTRAWMLGWAVMLLACGAEPTRFRVVDEVAEGGTFKLVDRALPTLTDVGSVSGDSAVFECGTKINLADLYTDYNSTGSVQRKNYVEEGSAPTAHWVDDNGVAVASDYDSLMLFSAYAHMETVVNYFKDLGVRPEATIRPVVHYLADIESGGALADADNAFYITLLDEFAIMPHGSLKGIPLAMNVGVIAHEFGHRVFAYEVEAPAAADYHGAQPTAETFNLLEAVNEGLSDYFAAMIMGDPAFLAPSFDNNPAIGASRDTSQFHAMNVNWVDGVKPTNSYGQYDPYPVGSVLASSLWWISTTVGYDIAPEVLSAQRALALLLGDRYEYKVGYFEALVVLQFLSASDKADACYVFRTLYSVVEDRFAGVCP